MSHLRPRGACRQGRVRWRPARRRPRAGSSGARVRVKVREKSDGETTHTKGCNIDYTNRHRRDGWNRETTDTHIERDRQKKRTQRDIRDKAKKQTAQSLHHHPPPSPLTLVALGVLLGALLPQLPPLLPPPPEEEPPPEEPPQPDEEEPELP